MRASQSIGRDSPGRLTHPCARSLASIDILSDLPAGDLAVLGRRVEILDCPRGAQLYARGDRAEALMLLLRGHVRLWRVTASGKRLEVAAFDAGTFVGEIPVGANVARQAFAEAAERCVVGTLRAGDLVRLIEAHPGVARRILEELGRRRATTEARLAEIAFEPVPARVAAALVRLTARPDRPIQVTHQEIGDMVGALRESVTKALEQFERRGIVELRRGSIILQDLPSLRALGGS